MKTKILISAIAFAVSGAAMAANPNPEAPLGDPQVNEQGPAGMPTHEPAKQQLGDPEIAQQGPEGGPASAKPKLQMGSEDVQNQGPAATENMTASSDFAALDKNDDGYISKDEASAEVKDHWETADANADGKLDQSEFSALEAPETGTTMGHEPAGEPSPGVTESGRAMDKMDESDK